MATHIAVTSHTGASAAITARVKSDSATVHVMPLARW
jgi:hypothetical protein